MDDELAAVGDHRLQFVHALSADPEFVVHRGRARKHGMERAGFARDVTLGAEVRRPRPGVGRRAVEHACEGVVGDDQAERVARGRHHRGSAIDYAANGRPFLSDDEGIGDDRAQPMEKVQDLGAADPRKQVLGTAREADDLVGKHRADDDELVVLQDCPIDGDRDILGEDAAR